MSEHIEAHYFDPKQDLLARLERAKEQQVEAIWYLVLECYEAVD